MRGLVVSRGTHRKIKSNEGEKRSDKKRKNVKEILQQEDISSYINSYLKKYSDKYWEKNDIFSLSLPSFCVLVYTLSAALKEGSSVSMALKYVSLFFKEKLIQEKTYISKNALKKCVSITISIEALDICIKSADLLCTGYSWDRAWSQALTEGKNKLPSVIKKKYKRDIQRIFGLIYKLALVLEPTWKKGAPPVVSLIALEEELQQKEIAILEENGAKLSVRLLLPVGICFLPAFIFFAIIPQIGSLIGNIQ